MKEAERNCKEYLQYDTKTRDRVLFFPFFPSLALKRQKKYSYCAWITLEENWNCFLGKHLLPVLRGTLLTIFPLRMRKQQPLLMLAQHTWRGSRNQKHKKEAVLVKGGWQQCTDLSPLCHIFQHRWGRRDPYLPLRGMHRSGAAPTHLWLCCGQYHSVGIQVRKCRCACWSSAGHQCGARHVADPDACSSTQHLSWPGKPKAERMQGQRRCAAGEVHPLDPALCQAFCSAHRQTHCSKVLVLWSISCPALCVPRGTSSSQESCDPKAKDLGTYALGQTKTQEHCTPLTELSPQEGNTTRTLADGFGGNLLKWKEKAVQRPVKRGVVGFQVYRHSYYGNTVLTVLQSCVYYQPG